MTKDIEILTYINERGGGITFSRKSQYHVNFKDISGLSSIRNEIFSIGGMGQHGETPIGDRIESRDIEIVGNIKERDKAAKRRLRRNLIRIMNPEYDAVLIYEFGTFKRIINCKVEYIPDPPSAVIIEPFIIQLNCANPFWRDEHETRHDIAAWLGGFEFPIRDADDQPDGLEICDVEGWEVGFREPSLIKNVPNEGDVRCGLRVDFRAIGVLTNPSILDVNTGKFIKFNISMVAGDVLTVNTGYGEKDVTFTRNGITTNAFRHLDPDSTYLQLEVGDNLFRYDAATNLGSLEVSIYQNNLYLSGV